MRLTPAAKEMTEAKFRLFLGHLPAAARMWQAEIDAIDVTPLHIEFRYGPEQQKVIEDQRLICVQLSDEIQAVISDLLRKQTVAGDIRILMALQFLHIGIVDLYRMLIDTANAIADMMGDEETKLVDSLRQRIRAVQEQYSGYILRMAEHTLARAALADAALGRENRRRGE